jgi:serine kinase of HPr protein (carbohydrate metabolism regulator)
MMQLREIIDNFNLKSLNEEDFDFDEAIEIRGCYIGDLLSNVMAHAQSGDIWLTVQTHQNVVAVAQLLNLGAIVFVEGHLPQEDTMDRARKERIPLLSTAKSAYELASGLSALGLERQKS